jgi:hypothetical protein
MPVEYKGSCLCGQVRYVIAGAIRYVSHCHCSMCRKAHGAAFATYATVPAASHRFLHGTDVLRVFNASGPTDRVFCSSCGSPMQWRNEVEVPGVAAFPLGGLDTPFQPATQRDIFVGSKAPWHQIGDAWPQSEEY